jgi:hypothetical protein
MNALLAQVEDLITNKESVYIAITVVFWFIMRTYLVQFNTVLARKINPKIKAKKTYKFAESFFFLFYYSTQWMLGMYLLQETPYLWDSSHFWRLYPHGMSTLFKAYYLGQLGFYLSAIVFESGLLTNMRKNYKDRHIMITHHLVTSGLIYLSYVRGFQRIGHMVFVLHDVSDILLELSKSMHYTDFTVFKIEVKNILFAVFAAVFFVSRLLIYPYHCIRSGLYETYMYLDDTTGVATANTLMIVLQCLHVYWFFLIMRMIIRAFKEKKIENDIRSDGEEDSLSGEETKDDTTPKKTKTNRTTRRRKDN